MNEFFSCFITDQSDVLFQSPKMHELMNHIAYKVPEKWFEVGIQLQIDMRTLESFENTYDNNQIRLFAKVFEQWRLDGKLPYTWNTIIITIEAIREYSLADDIRQCMAIGLEVN